MGLWDTVLSKAAGSYNLGIPTAFKHVSQALALNECRYLFPSVSIMGGAAPAGQTRVEMGFLGSHSDIGGSFADGDLAKVALVWMVNQATAAGVTMDQPDNTIIAIPASVQYVAHAVAANEHRSKFPLESIQNIPGSAGSETTARGWRVERGFIGAHADVGGGYNGTLGGDSGDLSDVALNWMYNQAEAAGVPLKDMDPANKIISNPIVHNERSTYPFCATIGGASFFAGPQDRKVNYGGGQSISETTAPIRGLNNAQSQKFITWDPNKVPDPACQQQNNQAGQVDMTAYKQWLAANYGVTLQ
jgi:Uncharacterized alpha/beta hydrolase domain (DUF2235)